MAEGTEIERHILCTMARRGDFPCEKSDEGYYECIYLTNAQEMFCPWVVVTQPEGFGVSPNVTIEFSLMGRRLEDLPMELLQEFPRLVFGENMVELAKGPDPEEGE